mmetsp:Transcript_19426/g.41841  ORF Transcript_19426/g.41841 Transcript_19426/m.41841 type:complete len:276 (+) Transcript_19426:150-977(+)
MALAPSLQGTPRRAHGGGGPHPLRRVLTRRHQGRRALRAARLLQPRGRPRRRPVGHARGALQGRELGGLCRPARVVLARLGGVPGAAREAAHLERPGPDGEANGAPSGRRSRRSAQGLRDVWPLPGAGAAAAGHRVRAAAAVHLQAAAVRQRGGGVDRYRGRRARRPLLQAQGRIRALQPGGAPLPRLYRRAARPLRRRLRRRACRRRDRAPRRAAPRRRGARRRRGEQARVRARCVRVAALRLSTPAGGCDAARYVRRGAAADRWRARPAHHAG